MKASLNTKWGTKQVVTDVLVPDNITISMTLEEARILAAIIGQIPPPQVRDWIQKAGAHQTMSQKRYDVFSTNPTMLTVIDVSDSLCGIYTPLMEQLRVAAELVEKTNRKK